MDSESATVVNRNTVELAGKRDGRVVFRETMIVSANGNTMTEKYEGHPEGSSEPVTATGLFSRLGPPEMGSDDISGWWKLDKWETVSANALTFVYASNGDNLNYTASTGESYNAKMERQGLSIPRRSGNDYRGGEEA